MVMRKLLFTRTSRLLLITCLLLLPLVAGDFLSHVDSVRAQIAGTARDLSPKQAEALIEQDHSNPNFVVLDVRTPKEFAAGHLSGAVNLDYHSTDFQQKISQLARNKTYLLYCQSGVRSGLSFQLMKELGFRNVYNLVGGISNWSRQGLKTVR